MSGAKGTLKPRTHARATQALTVLDGVTWVVAIAFAACVRYDFDFSQITWRSIAIICVFAVIMQVIFGFGTGLYRGRFVSGSFSEIRALFRAVLLTGAIVGIPVLVIGFQIHVARSIMLIAFPVAFMLMGTVRLVARLSVESRLRPAKDAKRTLIFGGGSLADHLVRRMVTEGASPYVPVGLIDDDPAKKNLRISGVPVLGDRRQIATAALKSRADAIIIGVARADGPLLQEISDLSRDAGLRVLVLPPLDEILKGKSSLGDVRDIAIDDILGRHSVDTQVESIAGYLDGRRVLVTGAGGSIGSELCRQIMRFSPAELIMLDHDETALQEVQLSISGHGLLDSREMVLADIRDADALIEIFNMRRPEVVFHAAALKHVPMLEQYPAEAWKTNVLGTQNVLDAAKRVGVATFVNISTDKAATPTGVLGQSKHLAEQLTAWAAHENSARYLSVRFGNVFGSRGSVVPVFARIIEAGGPVTVTHPDVTRFFMTVSEACQLVMQAGGIGSPGEVLILDMGEPVKILDIAERMIALSGRKIDIVYTGLRVGENLHEVLYGEGEEYSRPVHPQISHAYVSPLDPLELSVDSPWSPVESADSRGRIL